jgi:aryl-alcohol dehydrogenase-like predicted oxidoreductase
VPLKESIGALKVLQKKGLIRYWGVGNLTEKQISDTLSNEQNIPHQVHFNPINRNESVLDEGKDKCINCIVSPLEQGLLGIGTSSRGKEGIGKKDIRNRNPYFSDPKALQWNEKLDELSKVHSLSKVTAVLLWICSQPHVHAIIPGPRKRTQLEEILWLRRVIGDHGLLNAEKSGALLAVKKVKKLVYDELWECLSSRPVMDR